MRLNDQVGKEKTGFEQGPWRHTVITVRLISSKGERRQRIRDGQHVINSHQVQQEEMICTSLNIPFDHW